MAAGSSVGSSVAVSEAPPELVFSAEKDLRDWFHFFEIIFCHTAELNVVRGRKIARRTG